MSESNVPWEKGAGERLSPSAIRSLGQMLHGRVVCPGDEGFARARQVYNGAIATQPAVILQVVDRDEVARVVRFARAHGFPLAVKGRGHGLAGYALCEQGIVLDLVRMNRVVVDHVRRRAYAQGGADWRTFDRAAWRFGLATTGGSIPSTGVAGVTLGGGSGWLMGKYGLACDNLLAVELVLADGRVLCATSTQHADVFWGVRGGGGNFGVATRLVYRLHPLTSPLVGRYLYPLVRMQKVMHVYRLLTEDGSGELSCGVAFVPLRGQIVVLLLLADFRGEERARELARVIAVAGPPLQGSLQLLSYCALQALSDDSVVYGLPCHWRCGYLDVVSEEACEVMLSSLRGAASINIKVHLDCMCGAFCRIDPRETAFAHRDPAHSFLITAQWSRPQEAVAVVQWIEEFFAAMEPFFTGKVCVNFLGAEGQQRVIDAYGQNYQRLVALKSSYDPTNLFRFNQNIVPGE